MSVCGTKLGPSFENDGFSYHFSKYSICWGWATWARAWKCYDSKLEALDAVYQSRFLQGHLGGIRQYAYWKYILNKVRTGRINSWAYRWMFSCWINNGLSIIPKNNMISNIGVGDDATHTKDAKKYLGMRASGIEFPLVLHKNIKCNYKADQYIEDTIYSKSLVNRIMWAVDMFSSTVKRNL